MCVVTHATYVSWPAASLGNEIQQLLSDFIPWIIGYDVVTLTSWDAKFDDSVHVKTVDFMALNVAAITKSAVFLCIMDKFFFL
jgi:hypothetical protein